MGSARSTVVCTAATLARPWAGATESSIRASRLSSRNLTCLFFAFTRIDNFYIATPEKAILDTCYLRKALPTADELEMESINIDTLKEMARKFPQTVLKRIASLLPRGMSRFSQSSRAVCGSGKLDGRRKEFEMTAEIKPLTKRKAWKALEAHHKKVRDLHLRDLLKRIPSAASG